VCVREREREHVSVCLFFMCVCVCAIRLIFPTLWGNVSTWLIIFLAIKRLRDSVCVCVAVSPADESWCCNITQL